MTPYIVAAALTGLLFATFVAMARRGCGDPGCGSHASCAACPNANRATEPSDDH